MPIDETGLVHSLARRDEAAFEQVFKTHYKSLYAYAITLVKEEAAADEAVQTVFYKLWERTEGLSITGSVAAYLYRAVHNESLNYLKHLKVRTSHRLHVSYRMDNATENAGQSLQGKELEEKLRTAMNELPEQCRTIFQLSRFEELRYRDIAERLGISVKTVENQMGKALKLLRTKLVDFLTLIFLWLHL